MRSNRSQIFRTALGGGALSLLTLMASLASAELSFGVVSATLKVRPADAPQTSSAASLKAARNEFEAFQVVLTSDNDTDGVSVRLAKPLAGPAGATIPADNVVLYRAAYYNIKTASNSEGAAGRWPDPLIPDVDSYVGEKRDAFPLTVPAGESRVVWVDVLVPADATPGGYGGELEVLVGEEVRGTIAVALQVGSFSLPSTASLPSAFGMDYAQHCYAHTGFESCSKQWNEKPATVLRERYVRAALEHRFSLHNPFFQPPYASAINERLILPHITGTAPDTRLRGARNTTIVVDASSDKEIRKWIDYAKANGYHERLFHYPVDEPHGDAEWSKLVSEIDRMEGIDPGVPLILTASIREAEAQGVTDKIDIFVPVINTIDDRPDPETKWDEFQRPAYDPWLAKKPGRKLWAYQSCDSHGCGACGRKSPAIEDTGWPNRVIDATAVQTRAFPWVAFTLDIEGELYFAVAEQLETAWDADGLCAFSGSGDGTIFYPGKPSLIGGETDIPIESIRMKLIREGMEDYEYLVQAAAIDEARAREIALTLFPHAYETNQPESKLRQARDALFTLLDTTPPPVGGDGGAGGSTQGDGGAGSAGDGTTDDQGSGCGCQQGGTTGGSLALLSLLLLVCLLRRRLAGQGGADDGL